MKHPGSSSIYTIHPNGSISHGWIVAEQVSNELTYKRRYCKDCAIFHNGDLIQHGTAFSEEELTKMKRSLPD